MKVLITGGCGFLGSNLAASFLLSDDRVFILDGLYRNGSSQNLEWLNTLHSKNLPIFEQHNIADKASVEAFFRRYGPFDLICHVAGQVAMTSSLADPRFDFETNCLGTFNLLEATRNHSHDALFAYSSTNKVYGDLKWIEYLEQNFRYSVPAFPDGFSESLPLDFSTPYGCSKGSADQYVRDWGRVFGLKTVVFRHSSIYGGRQFATFDQGWIGWFIQQALRQKDEINMQKHVNPFTIQGTGKQVRDILHSNDLIALYRKAYSCRDQLSGEVLNIGGGLNNSLSLIELFSLLEEKLSISLAYTHLPKRASDQDFFVADISKVKSVLNWSPSVNISDGIDLMIDWCNGTQK